MGNKQSGANGLPSSNKSFRQSAYNLSESPQQQQNEENLDSNNSKLRIKRRLTNKNQSINRSSSSPVIAKCRFENNNSENKNSNNLNIQNNYNNNNNKPLIIQNQIQQPVQTTPTSTLPRSPLAYKSTNNNNYTTSSSSNSISNVTSHLTVHSPLKINNSSIINLNNQLKQKQQDLTTAIKKIDSSQPSHHLNSKLYKPNSFLLATSLSNKQDLLPNKFDLKSKINSNSNTLPARNMIKKYDDENCDSPKVRISPKVVVSDNTSSNSKTKPTYKLAKRFGLSPRFKRKIVETITNRVNSNSGGSNHKFGQSRLLQALQSQWNLFTSISSSRNNLNKSDFEDDNEDYLKGPNPFQRKRRFEPTSTFLLTSVERNSFRYASRRKYKTQSLVNPYRHADTNYPVYIHEALFMPEFSVKGQVTEADFEILDVISRGAFGHVIKVKKKSETSKYDDESNSSDDQIYAMKIMWKSQVIRDRALQQVKDEVTIATSCVDNPLIVKTWFYWQSKRFLYIITDYVENGELLSLWLKVHHFPERLVAVYAIEMCLVLDYLHKRGIIYRDIKMENILLDQRGHIQLIDFGLSKWLKLGDKTCTICGTIQYMAPEILSVEPYDHSVDWWSLGILIYALLSGEYPLNAAKDHIQMNEKVSKHVFELDQSTGRYSLESCDLIRKLLRKNPQRRLKSLNEIKQDTFFTKELNNFINSYALEKSKPVEEVSLLAHDNYWNPYFIIQNYSPLQLLFDEIYSLKNKNKNEKEKIKHENNAKIDNHTSNNVVVKPKTRVLMPKTVKSAQSTSSLPPAPPAPPTQTMPQTSKITDNSLSSSSTSSTSNCSDSATRTTTSIPNTSSDDMVEDIVEGNESECFKLVKKSFEVKSDDLGAYGDDENDDYDEEDDEIENQYYEYENDDGSYENETSDGFTKF